MIRKKYTVADFFAGCGGLSHGFELTGRYNAVLGSDIKPEALETLVAFQRTLELFEIDAQLRSGRGRNANRPLG